MSDYSELKRLAEHMNELCGGQDGVLMHVTTADVLALIAENELLRGPEETVTSARGDKLFTFMSKDPCRYRLCEATYANPVRALIAERDQLRAENAGLQTGYKAYEQVNAELRDEVEALREGANFRAIQSLRQDCEALRKDAERYRWLRGAKHFDSPQHRAFCEFYADGLDVAIDAAISSPENP